MDPDLFAKDSAAGQPEFLPPEPGQKKSSKRRSNHIVRHYQSQEPIIPLTTRVAQPVTVRTTPEQARQAAEIASAAFKPSVPAPAFQPDPTAAALVSGDASTGTAEPASHKVLMISLVIVGIIIIAVAGVVGAYLAANTNPDNILKAALNNEISGKVTTVKYDGSLAVGKTTKTSAIISNFSGDMSRSGAGDMTGTITMANTTTSIQAASSDGKTVYLKGNNLENLAPLLFSNSNPNTPAGQQTLAHASQLLKTINNQWQQVDQATFNSLLRASPTQTLVTNLSAQSVTAIENLYAQYPFLNIVTKYSNQTVAGSPSYHYQVQADRTQLEAFVLALQNANVPNLKFNGVQLIGLQSLLQNTNLANWPIDVWISTTSHVFTRLSLANPDSGTTLIVNLHDFNTPITVTVPDGAKPLDKSLAQLMTTAKSQ